MKRCAKSTTPQNWPTNSGDNSLVRGKPRPIGERFGREIVAGIWYETHGKNTQIVVEVRQNSNFNGIADNDDTATVAGLVDVVLSDGTMLEGTTDNNGLFRSNLIKHLASGTLADVVNLALEGFAWNPLELDLEDDSNGDGFGRRYADCVNSRSLRHIRWDESTFRF